MKKRYSNIELLRVVSMMMILSLHSFTWNRASGSDGYIHSLSLGVGLDYFRESLCLCAVNVYVLISGFFSIKWKWKSILSFVFQVYFWSLSIYCLMIVLGEVPFSYTGLFNRINCLIGDYWFVEAYLGLYLLSPILNAFSEKVHKRNVLILILLFVVFEVYSQLLGSSMNFNRGYNTLSLCCVYMIGRLLFLYQDELCGLKYRCKQYLSIYLFSAIIISCIALNQLVVKGYDYMTIQKSFNFAYNNPLVIIESVGLFLLFNEMKFFSKVVNYAAGSIFAVYLLHMHPDVKQYYYTFTGQLYDKPVIHHVLVLICLFCAILICSVFVDRIRLWLFSFFYTKCKKLILKVCNTRR